MDKYKKMIRADLWQERIVLKCPKSGIFLDKNEQALAHEDDFDDLNRYPDPYARALSSHMAAFHGISNQNIHLQIGMAGLQLSLLQLMPQSSVLITLQPSIKEFENNLKIIQMNERRLELDFRASSGNLVDEIMAQWTPDVKSIWIDQPSALTGQSLPQEAILELCEHLKQHCLIVVNESLVEYCSEPSLCPQLSANENLLLIRSYDAAFRLAGLGLCSLMSHETFIQHIQYWFASTIPTPIQRMALEWMTNSLQLESKIAVSDLMALRHKWKERFRNLECVDRIEEGSGNFLVIHFKEPAYSKRLLQNQNIWVGDLSFMPGYEKAVRITIGSEAEMLSVYQIMDTPAFKPTIT